MFFGLFLYNLSNNCFLLLPSAVIEAVWWLSQCSARPKICSPFAFISLPLRTAHTFAEFALGFWSTFNDTLDLILANAVVYSPEISGFRVILDLYYFQLSDSLQFFNLI